MSRPHILTAKQANRATTLGGTTTENWGKVLHPLQAEWVLQRLKQDRFCKRWWYHDLFEKYRTVNIPIEFIERVCRDLQCYYDELVPILETKRIITQRWQEYGTGERRQAGFNTAIISRWWLKKYAK